MKNNAWPKLKILGISILCEKFQEPLFAMDKALHFDIAFSCYLLKNKPLHIPQNLYLF